MKPIVQGTRSRRLAGLLLVACALLVTGNAGAGETLYVRAAATELRAAANPGGAITARLDIGTKVDVVSKQGNWVQVKVADKTGFVFAAKLGKDKPDKERLGGKVVASASESDTAQALRGLSPTAEKYATRSKISAADVEAVKRIEKEKVPSDELAAFLKDGKLGEYME